MNTNDTKELMQLSYKLHTLNLRYNAMLRCGEVSVVGDINKHNEDCEFILKEIEGVLLDINKLLLGTMLVI